MAEPQHDASGPATTRRPWLRNYNSSTATTLDLPETSLVHVMENSVRTAGTKTALEFFGRRTNYATLGDQVHRAAEGLRGLGVRKGDRVAVILPNCPQHVVAFYAILRVGGVVVEHNPLYTEGELRHQFEDHGAKVAFVWDKIAEKVTQQPGDVRPRHVVAVNLVEAMPAHMRAALKLPLGKAKASREKLEGAAPGTIPWRKLLKNEPIAEDHERPTAHDTALLLYTSGTSGTPKGVVLTHRNLESNAQMGQKWIGLDDDEVIYGLLPLFHAYGMTLGLGISVAVQAKLVLFPTVDLDLVFKALKKSKPTILPAVPPIYRRMLDMAEERGTDLSDIRYSVSGAMNLPRELVSDWEAKTGGFLVEGYGLTECAPLVACNPLNASRRVGSIGTPFPSTDIRIVDPESLQDAEDGEPGELWVKGPQRFRGYWKNEEATRAALTEDGWLRTGDVVTMDEDGFLFVVDRLKEVIITGGFNVSPSEVETALKTSDAVEDAAVVGIESENGGEDVVAAVIMAPGHTLDVEALRQHCYTKVTRYKVPRRIVELADFPRSMLGKTLRREVKKQVREKL